MTPEMMALPGLARLLETCRKHGVSVDTSPPANSLPVTGALVAGHPFDPILAAVYRHFSRMRIAGENGEFELHRFDEQVDGLSLVARDRRQGTREPFYSAVAFGSIPDLEYYFATVPELADERGRQPVIYINAYPERTVLPVASNVDRFFDTLSRYLELLQQDTGYRFDGIRDTQFPEGVPELITQDEALVRLLRSGRMDFILNPHDEFQEWMARVKLGR